MAVKHSAEDVTVKIDGSNRKIRLLWPDNQSAEFHYVWLRHHARCPEGLPNDTSVKIDLIPDDPASLVINRCAIKGECLEIEWGDQELKTLHPIPALASMQYGRASRQDRKPLPIFWPQDNNDPIPCYPYTDLHDPASLLQIGLSIRDVGIVRIKDVPLRPGTVADVAL